MKKQKKEGCCGKLKNLFFHPKKFFEQVEPEKDYSKAVFFYVKIALIGIIIQFILSGITLFARGTQSLTQFLNLITSSITSIAFAFIMPFIIAVIIHLGVLMFKGKQGIFNTYKPITYSLAIWIVYSVIYSIIIWPIAMINSSSLDLANMTPDMLIQNTGFLTLIIIYGIILLISLIHFLYASVMGLSRFQKINKLRAFFSIILIPLILIILAVALIIYSSSSLINAESLIPTG